jgi:hypothetical protein
MADGMNEVKEGAELGNQKEEEGEGTERVIPWGVLGNDS